MGKKRDKKRVVTLTGRDGTTRTFTAAAYESDVVTAADLARLQLPELLSPFPSAEHLHRTVQLYTPGSQAYIDAIAASVVEQLTPIIEDACRRACASQGDD